MRETQSLLSELFRAEFHTTPGRINAAGTLLAFVASGLAGLASTAEWFVRIFKPTYTSNYPTLQIFIVFAVVFVSCVALLAWLEVRLEKADYSLRRPSLSAKAAPGIEDPFAKWRKPLDPVKSDPHPDPAVGVAAKSSKVY
jgi:hypothetical protein